MSEVEHEHSAAFSAASPNVGNIISFLVTDNTVCSRELVEFATAKLC